MSAALPVRLLHSVASLAPAYEAWLCDVWGVMHNGLRAFDDAVDACRRFRQSGGIVVLLSNAPRPAVAVQAQLDHLAVPRDAYDEIVTSGDLTRHFLAQQRDTPIFHLGPERDRGLFTGLDVRFANEADAGLILCSGLFNDEVETPAHYTDRFAALVKRDVPMICANPDLKVERGDKLIYCGGALGAEYERLGGRVVYAGKPHLQVYELAFDRVSALRGTKIPNDRILAIGDGLRTDIRGAHDAGIASLFIASAIHVSGKLDDRQLDVLFATSDARPIAAMSALAW